MLPRRRKCAVCFHKEPYVANPFPWTGWARHENGEPYRGYGGVSPGLFCAGFPNIDPAAASDPITSLPGAWLLSSSMNMQSPYRSAGAECAGDNSNAVTFGLSFRQRKRLQRSVEQKLRHRLLAALYEHANELESSAFPSLHHRKEGWPSD